MLVFGNQAGVSYLESLTHNEKTVVFNGGKIGEVTSHFLRTLKGIQYGALGPTWMVPVEPATSGPASCRPGSPDPGSDRFSGSVADPGAPGRERSPGGPARLRNTGVPRCLFGRVA